MQDEAYANFRERYLAVRKAEEKERNDMLRIQDQSIRQLEGRHASVMKAVEDGDYSPPVIAQLSKVDAELSEARARRATEAPEPVELPEDLPEIYRAHIDELADTLSDEDVSGRASEELHSLIDTVVVDWDGE
ncbi:recombinase family protein, partial [Roseovarius sp. S4756]